MAFIECPDCGQRVANLMAHGCLKAGKNERKGKNDESGHPADARRDDRRKVSRSDKTQPQSSMAASGDVSRGTQQEPVKPTGKVGRPKVEGERPWEAEGVSRRTYYRNREK